MVKYGLSNEKEEGIMKKWIALLGFVSILSVGTAAFASGLDVAKCAQYMGGDCVSMCAQAQGMTHGVSECATSTNCPMK
jgi:hypothetical protein